MLTALEYPIDLLQCGTMEWQVVGGAVEGMRSLAADTPDRLAIGRGGLWKCEMDHIFLETREEYAAWRAIRGQLRNGTVRIVVPLVERPWFAQPRPAAAVPHSDGTFFSDGSGYQSGAVEARLLEDAAHAATTLRLRVLGAEPFIGAEPFTIVHPNAAERVYEVVGVVESVEVTNDAGGVVGFDYRLDINPPLRERVAAGDEADFNAPRCAMRLSDSNGMALPEDIVSFGTVTFIEDLRALRGELP
ncbi:hypothetical protein [Hansschlegelia plantiphila]|uniref:Uncharacterized protein n=1 Tax=Hansschlegelia plantiphila TaxID=374655 RepID=A0A9W6MUK9_9HYPH|nr:hypothetical protein [Hansschlegelia plantiphila]GLK67003.1 hypothetical protein GCM10008179_06410 [Hansschlegelia plantiphila]